MRRLSLVGGFLGVVLFVAAPVRAEAPDTSPRPVARSVATDGGAPIVGEGDAVLAVSTAAVVAPVVSTAARAPASRLPAAPVPKVRPAARPYVLSKPVDPVAQALTSDDLADNTASLAQSWSPRPSARPGNMVQKAMARQRETARGSICGDPELQGTAIGYVPGRIRGCGVQDAVKVRSVAGVALSTQATMDCETAKALKRWVNSGMKPAVGNRGGGVREIHVVAHYVCRTRNNQRGGRISEHGKGRAIDIAGFRLRDGSEITLLRGWNERSTSGILRRMHTAACGPFGTVLGPNANKFHRDHFHFDTAQYRSGPYCR